jgi:biopolymer transport protein ExbB/TolQ
MYYAKALCILLLICFSCSFASAELIDRVVAFIDNEAITLSELEEELVKAKEIKPSISKLELLQSMINKRLLLREAKRLRIQAPDDAALLEEYMELKVKAFIKVPEEDMKSFYRENKKEFGKLKFAEVKDRIETYLREKETNRRLKKHIEQLKEAAHINIHLD